MQVHVCNTIEASAKTKLTYVDRSSGRCPDANEQILALQLRHTALLGKSTEARDALRCHFRVPGVGLERGCRERRSLPWRAFPTCRRRVVPSWRHRQLANTLLARCVHPCAYTLSHPACLLFLSVCICLFSRQLESGPPATTQHPGHDCLNIL